MTTTTAGDEQWLRSRTTGDNQQMTARRRAADNRSGLALSPTYLSRQPARKDEEPQRDKRAKRHGVIIVAR